MAPRKLLAQQSLVGAIHRHGGVLSLVARELGTTRQNIHQRVGATPELQAAVAEAEEALLDLAEGNLVRLLRRGDRVTTMWYLTRKGRSRGYGNNVTLGLDGARAEAFVASLGGSVEAYRAALRQLGVPLSEIP